MAEDFALSLRALKATSRPPPPEEYLELVVDDEDDSFPLGLPDASGLEKMVRLSEHQKPAVRLQAVDRPVVSVAAHAGAPPVVVQFDRTAPRPVAFDMMAVDERPPVAVPVVVDDEPEDVQRARAALEDARSTIAATPRAETTVEYDPETQALAVYLDACAEAEGGPIVPHTPPQRLLEDAHLVEDNDAAAIEQRVRDLLQAQWAECKAACKMANGKYYADNELSVHLMPLYSVKDEYMLTTRALALTQYVTHPSFSTMVEHFQRDENPIFWLAELDIYEILTRAFPSTKQDVEAAELAERRTPMDSLFPDDSERVYWGEGPTSFGKNQWKTWDQGDANRPEFYIGSKISGRGLIPMESTSDDYRYQSDAVVAHTGPRFGVFAVCEAALKIDGRVMAPGARMRTALRDRIAADDEARRQGALWKQLVFDDPNVLPEGPSELQTLRRLLGDDLFEFFQTVANKNPNLRLFQGERVMRDTVREATEDGSMLPVSGPSVWSNMYLLYLKRDEAKGTLFDLMFIRSLWPDKTFCVYSAKQRQSGSMVRKGCLFAQPDEPPPGSPENAIPLFRYHDVQAHEATFALLDAAAGGDRRFEPLPKNVTVHEPVVFLFSRPITVHRVEQWDPRTYTFYEEGSFRTDWDNKKWAYSFFPRTMPFFSWVRTGGIPKHNVNDTCFPRTLAGPQSRSEQEWSHAGMQRVASGIVWSKGESTARDDVGALDAEPHMLSNGTDADLVLNAVWRMHNKPDFFKQVQDDVALTNDKEGSAQHTFRVKALTKNTVDSAEDTYLVKEWFQARETDATLLKIRQYLMEDGQTAQQVDATFQKAEEAMILKLEDITSSRKYLEGTLAELRAYLEDLFPEMKGLHAHEASRLGNEHVADLKMRMHKALRAARPTYNGGDGSQDEFYVAWEEKKEVYQKLHTEYEALFEARRMLETARSELRVVVKRLATLQEERNRITGDSEYANDLRERYNKPGGTIKQWEKKVAEKRAAVEAMEATVATELLKLTDERQTGFEGDFNDWIVIPKGNFAVYLTLQEELEARPVEKTLFHDPKLSVALRYLTEPIDGNALLYPSGSIPKRRWSLYQERNYRKEIMTMTEKIIRDKAQQIADAVEKGTNKRWQYTYNHRLNIEPNDPRVLEQALELLKVLQNSFKDANAYDFLTGVVGGAGSIASSYINTLEENLRETAEGDGAPVWPLPLRQVGGFHTDSAAQPESFLLEYAARLVSVQNTFRRYTDEESKRLKLVREENLYSQEERAQTKIILKEWDRFKKDEERTFGPKPSNIENMDRPQKDGKLGAKEKAQRMGYGVAYAEEVTPANDASFVEYYTQLEKTLYQESGIAVTRYKKFKKETQDFQRALLPFAAYGKNHPLIHKLRDPGVLSDSEAKANWAKLERYVAQLHEWHEKLQKDMLDFSKLSIDFVQRPDEDRPPIVWHAAFEAFRNGLDWTKHYVVVRTEQPVAVTLTGKLQERVIQNALLKVSDVRYGAMETQVKEQQFELRLFKQHYQTVKSVAMKAKGEGGRYEGVLIRFLEMNDALRESAAAIASNGVGAGHTLGYAPEPVERTIRGVRWWGDPYKVTLHQNNTSALGEQVRYTQYEVPVADSFDTPREARWEMRTVAKQWELFEEARKMAEEAGFNPVVDRRCKKVYMGQLESELPDVLCEHWWVYTLFVPKGMMPRLVQHINDVRVAAETAAYERLAGEGEEAPMQDDALFGVPELASSWDLDDVDSPYVSCARHARGQKRLTASHFQLWVAPFAIVVDPGRNMEINLEFLQKYYKGLFETLAEEFATIVKALNEEKLLLQEFERQRTSDPEWAQERPPRGNPLLYNVRGAKLHDAQFAYLRLDMGISFHKGPFNQETREVFWSVFSDPRGDYTVEFDAVSQADRLQLEQQGQFQLLKLPKNETLWDKRQVQIRAGPEGPEYEEKWDRQRTTRHYWLPVVRGSPLYPKWILESGKIEGELEPMTAPTKGASINVLEPPWVARRQAEMRLTTSEYEQWNNLAMAQMLIVGLNSNDQDRAKATEERTLAYGDATPDAIDKMKALIRKQARPITIGSVTEYLYPYAPDWASPRYTFADGSWWGLRDEHFFWVSVPEPEESDQNAKRQKTHTTTEKLQQYLMDTDPGFTVLSASEQDRRRILHEAEMNAEMENAPRLRNPPPQPLTELDEVLHYWRESCPYAEGAKAISALLLDDNVTKVVVRATEYNTLGLWGGTMTNVVVAVLDAEDPVYKELHADTERATLRVGNQHLISKGIRLQKVPRVTYAESVAAWRPGFPPPLTPVDGFPENEGYVYLRVPKPHATIPVTIDGCVQALVCNETMGVWHPFLGCWIFFYGYGVVDISTRTAPFGIACAADRTDEDMPWQCLNPGLQAQQETDAVACADRYYPGPLVARVRATWKSMKEPDATQLTQALTNLLEQRGKVANDDARFTELLQMLYPEGRMYTDDVAYRPPKLWEQDETSKLWLRLANAKTSGLSPRDIADVMAQATDARFERNDGTLLATAASGWPENTWSDATPLVYDGSVTIVPQHVNITRKGKLRAWKASVRYEQLQAEKKTWDAPPSLTRARSSASEQRLPPAQRLRLDSGTAPAQAPETPPRAPAADPESSAQEGVEGEDAGAVAYRLQKLAQIQNELEELEGVMEEAHRSCLLDAVLPYTPNLRHVVTEARFQNLQRDPVYMPVTTGVDREKAQVLPGQLKDVLEHDGGENVPFHALWNMTNSCWLLPLQYDEATQRVLGYAAVEEGLLTEEAYDLKTIQAQLAGLADRDVTMSDNE